MAKVKLTEDKAENTPAGGVLIGKRKGQTMIHNKGSLSGYLVGRTHAKGGIDAVNTSTGQPLNMQGGEVIITAPAVADQTKNEFNGKMMTNREILSQINVNGGGVAFAKGGDIPKRIKRTGASYKYGGKTMTDHEIYKKITGGHLAEGMTLTQIAKKHNVSVKDLQKQVELGMKAESEHTSSKREQMKIVKDHLFENPEYYTLLKKAGLKHGGRVSRASIIRNTKKANSQTKDLNNLNDVLDIDADGVYGAETGLFAGGGGVGKETVLFAVKKGEPDYAEVLITNNPDRIEDAKKWALANGFDRLRVSKIDMNRKPDFKKTFANGSGIGIDEYEYVLTQRPFDIGTYPLNNFIRFEEKDFQYGVVIYSEPLSIDEMERYSLSPITEIKDYDGKILDYKIGNLKLKARVKLETDKRKGYYVNLFISDNNGIKKTQPMSGVNFLMEIKNGRLILENESTVEPMNEKVNKKEKSFESEGSTEGKGKLYEFFTPQIVADKMLALAQHYGFKGGNVLEPATGSGRLIKNLKNTNITAFEISKDNFEILKREFPNAELYNFNFEKAFLKEPRFNTLINRKGTETWLKNAPFDLVMANPPYGKFSGLYSSYFNFKGQVEHFFILQTLYLLKKGGLGVYLIPSSFLRNGVAYNEIKKQIFEIAEFVDAYRLPSNIFEKTQIGTDILILRKK